MNAGDRPIPDDDAIAAAARRALRRLSDRAPAEVGPWATVQARARRVRRQRLTAVGAGCAMVLAAAGTALAVANGGGSRAPRIAEPAPRTTTTAPTTTETPRTEASSPRTTPMPPSTAATTPQPATATSPSAPPDLSKIYPGDAPGVDDFDGTITIDAGNTSVHTVNEFDEVDVTTNIRNITDRTIWASGLNAPTGLATVCTSGSTGRQSLWFMTNFRMSPGDNDGRGGKFWLTHDYIGSVTCELDLVSFDTSGATGTAGPTQFDASTYGDEATGTIVGRVTGVAPVTLQVVPVDFTLTALGRLNPLQLGASTEDDVRVAMGSPEATAISMFTGSGRPDYQALGYECTDGPSADRIPLHAPPTTVGPFCRTVFYVNVETERLAGFSTSSTMFHTEHGTTVGMTETDAEQREAHAPQAGCFTGIAIGELPHDDIEVNVSVGVQPTDTVSRISAEEAMNEVGVLSCSR